MFFDIFHNDFTNASSSRVDFFTKIIQLFREAGEQARPYNSTNKNIGIFLAFLIKLLVEYHNQQVLHFC